MIKVRFVSRDPEEKFECVRGWFGREKVEHVSTHYYHPILQLRANGGEWISVPTVNNKDEWLKAIVQIEKDYVD
jgi:hypothetical protein